MSLWSILTGKDVKKLNRDLMTWLDRITSKEFIEKDDLLDAIDKVINENLKITSELEVKHFMEFKRHKRKQRLPKHTILRFE